MDQNYLSLANSTTLFLIVLIPIVIAVVQAILFLRLGLSEAKNLEVPKPTLRKVMINSSIFSIIPSLPIIITLAILMPVLGKYIPWLRLSVIGSAIYESMAADMTIKSFGLSGLGDMGITSSIFVSIVWVMTLAILVGPTLNIFLLKTYDKKLRSIRSSGGFLAVATGALFIGMLSLMGVPLLMNVANPLGIIAAVTAGVSVLLLDGLAKRTGKKAISEFSFPMSMILGMASTIIVTNLL